MSGCGGDGHSHASPRRGGGDAAAARGGQPVAARLDGTTFDDDESLYAALRAGAGGFLLKNAPPEQLVGAVRTVAAGEGLLSPAVTRRVIEEFARRSPRESPQPDSLAELTERELEVLRLMARGLSNAEIGEQHVITTGTAKTHVGRIS